MHENSSCVQIPAGSEVVTFVRDETGQGMVEYVLVILLIALAVIGFLPPVASALVQLVNKIVAAFQY